MSRLPIEFADVERAAARLKGVAHRTPLLRSRTLDDRVGAEVVLKAEGFQRAGAFKFRGAFNCVSLLSDEERAAGVVTASSGNHAQALALAASLHGAKATILMPADAPESKRAATEGYGARVVEFDRYADDREALMSGWASEHGLTIVHPYDDPRVMAGAGTVGLELVQDADALDVVVVPLGGGGLLSGCVTAVKALSPATRVVGVEPQASDDFARSLRAGARVRVDVTPSIADGQLLPTPGELTWQVVSALVDDVVSVSDDEIREAMHFLFERCKLVAEPSGASALAAVLARSGTEPFLARRIGVVLSGANVSAQRFAELLG